MTSVPVSRVVWYINGIEIHPSERTRVVQEGRTVVLIIINVGVQDSGEYMLKVQNELGEVTCKTTLIIKGKSLVITSNEQSMNKLKTTTKQHV